MPCDTTLLNSQLACISCTSLALECTRLFLLSPLVSVSILVAEIFGSSKMLSVSNPEGSKVPRNGLKSSDFRD
jgi:hypothetical protein